jgi:hypothetical protein
LENDCIGSGDIMNYHHKDTVKMKSKEGDWVTKNLELLLYSIRDEIVSK